MFNCEQLHILGLILYHSSNIRGVILHESGVPVTEDFVPKYKRILQEWHDHCSLCLWQGCVIVLMAKGEETASKLQINQHLLKNN